MGKVLKPIGALVGIGQEDAPTFAPNTSSAGLYKRFSENTNDERDAAYGASLNTLREGPLTKSLFGAGGLQDRLGSEEQRLASQGYSLQPQDHEAYGQASGNISRQFGQQEQDLSKMLARRGLGGGSSGAAGAGFSGLAGSKNEMLARAQTDIAQKRMADTNQRLLQTRSMLGSLGMGGQQAANEMANDRFGSKSSALLNAANLERTTNQEGRQANEDAIGHKSKNIGDAMAEGGYSAANKLTSGAFATDLVGNTSQGPDSGKEKQGGGGAREMNPNASSGGSGSTGASKAGGFMSMFSDENLKTNVQDGSQEVRGFLDSLEPHKYEYADSVKGSLFGGEGEHVSPMAQELEQTELGANMVEDTPDGKVVDYGKGFGAILAGMADVNARLNAIEGRK